MALINVLLSKVPGQDFTQNPLVSRFATNPTNRPQFVKINGVNPISAFRRTFMLSLFKFALFGKHGIRRVRVFLFHINNSEHFRKCLNTSRIWMNSLIDSHVDKRNSARSQFATVIKQVWCPASSGRDKRSA